jgi:transcriptional regulator with XRE-family HTH domain
VGDAGVGDALHVAQRFEHLLDTFRRPDGSRWTGQQLDEATDGVVPCSYVTNLRKGRIESPGYEKMMAIAKAMGFPPEAWFEDAPDSTRAASAEGQDLAGRVQHLFGAGRRPMTGEPYTNSEVARMSVGSLTEGEVEGIRTGVIPDPTVTQVTALAAAFGVPPSYLLDWGKDPSLLDEELLEGLRDETTRRITREAMRMPKREKRIVLGIVRQFEAQRGAPARKEPSGK